jgi:Asp-tRNA(Asn)/Glu-tRNA(Gln) amidotransferase A subunit family amidase
MLYSELPDIVGLLELIDAKKIETVDIIEQYLFRLKKYHPIINGATKIYEKQALREAQESKGKLAGIPFSVKEMYDIKGERVDYGTKFHKTDVANKDAEAVLKLRKEGAVMLCKSNIPELSMFTETNNLVYGRTNNPYDITRTCGGSSGGDGALVSSGSVVFGLGSDIGGSIRIPAAFCGCVGFKPASFHVSKKGSHHDLSGTFSDSCLSNGPLTRSVRDAFYIYDILCDTNTMPIQNTDEIRVMIPDEFLMRFENKSIYNSFEYVKSYCLTEFKNVESFTENRMNDLGQDFLRLLVYDVYEKFRKILSTEDGEIFSVKREAYNQLSGNPQVWNPVFISMLGMRLLAPDNATQYKLAKKVEQIKAEYYSRMDENTVIILPTIGTIAPKHGEMVSKVNNPILSRVLNPTIMCNILDFSAIAVPDFIHVNYNTQMPSSIMICGKPGSEKAIYTVASILEKLLKK